VITALKARADEDLIALVQWLTVDKQKGNPIPFVKCESLRSAIANLETLKAGVHTRWKQALGLMEAEIQKSSFESFDSGTLPDCYWSFEQS
jgi:hypothetical protein